MKTNSGLGALADQVRDIPLSHVLEQNGYQGKAEGRSLMFRSDDYAINVTGSQWFDHKAGKGGGGAIDLAIHLLGSNFRDACLWLAHISDIAPVERTALPLKETPCPSFSQQFAEYATRDDSRWSDAWKYLVQTRALPPNIVEDLFQQESVYANGRSGVVFCHYDSAGKLAGATIRSIHHASGFRQCIGDKTTAWFSAGVPFSEASTVVITESPIDALSYLALRPTEQCSFVSASGNHVSSALLKWIIGNGARPVLALDNDKAGRDGMRRAVELWRKDLAQSQTTPIQSVTSWHKDWNADLVNQTYQWNGGADPTTVNRRS